jgi:hypothetical protein
MYYNEREKRISKLTQDRETFFSYVDRFYKKRVFSGPSVYFHRKVIQLIREHENYEELLQENLFLEYIYAALTSWGVHMVGGGRKMAEYDAFKESILSCKPLLVELNKFKIHDLGDADKKSVKEKLLQIFRKLKVTQTDPKLVGNSKALHHLLPDLVPPIDGKYTINFFYGSSVVSTYLTREEEEKIFLEIFESFNYISKKLGLTEADYLNDKRGFTTSIPKLVDNAIIGLMKV